MQLLSVQYPDKPTRYFVDGVRVSRDRYDAAKFWKRLECFQTIQRGERFFHYVVAR